MPREESRERPGSSTRRVERKTRGERPRPSAMSDLIIGGGERCRERKAARDQGQALEGSSTGQEASVHSPQL